MKRSYLPGLFVILIGLLSCSCSKMQFANRIPSQGEFEVCAAAHAEKAPSLTSTKDSVNANSVVVRGGIEKDKVDSEISGEQKQGTVSIKIASRSGSFYNKKVVSAIFNHPLAPVRISQDNPHKTVEPFALVSFLLGLASFISLPFINVLAIVLFILVIVFASISLSKLNAQPDKYKGKGFAIAGLILGILGFLIIGAIIVLLILYFR